MDRGGIDFRIVPPVHAAVLKTALPNIALFGRKTWFWFWFSDLAGLFSFLIVAESQDQVSLPLPSGRQ